MNYYEELILELESLQRLKKYTEIEQIIIEELKAPYIPRDIESKLHSLLAEVKQNKPVNSKVDRYNIDEYFFGNSFQQQLAIHFLKDAELDSFKDLIATYLISNARDDFKKMLLVILIERKYEHIFQFTTSKQETTALNPASITSFLENQTIVSLMDYFENKYYNNPSFLKLSLDILNLIYIHQLPQEINQQELNEIKQFIESYLDDNFNQNIHQKSSNSYYYDLIYKVNE